MEDSQHGRGLGSILLEHLAAAARERGVRRFTAEVLSQNTKMLRVFMDAGYTVHRTYDSGVVELVFDIDPTERSRAVMTAREHRAEARSIARLLAPRSIAVIGASHQRGTLGRIVLENLLRGDFAGPVYPVTPHAVSVQGVRAYADVTDIPDPVDLAVVTVPAADVLEAVEQCRSKEVHALVVMTAGFADAGSSGDQEQRKLVALARDSGMRVLGPELPGPGEHRSVRTDERDRWHRWSRRPAGSASSASPGRWASPSWRTPQPAGSGFPRSSRPAIGPMCPATTCCSSGTATTGPRWCCCTWSRSAIHASSPGWLGCWPGRNRSSR